jgi:putative MATE family efflux protein
MKQVLNQFQSEKGYTKKIFIIGLPLLFASITRYLYQISDSAMLGHFGNDSNGLAAIGIASLYTWNLMNFLWPMSIGVQAIASRRFGLEKKGSVSAEHTGNVLNNGFVTIVYAFLLCLAASFLARPILSMMIQNTDVRILALQYIGIIRYGLLPFGFMIVISGFFGAINRTSYLMTTSIISNVLNVIFNYILIYGKLGFPQMGIQGAAWGTVVSQIIAFGIFLIIVFVKGYKKKYKIFQLRNMQPTLQRDIVKVALPPAIQNIIALSIILNYQAIIEDYSTAYLAATHVVFSYFRLNKIIVGGFSGGAGILVGNALGVKDKKSAWILGKNAFVIAFLSASCVAAFSFFGRGFVASIFSENPITIVAIETAITFFTLFYLIEAAGFCFEVIFNSNGFGKYVLFSEFTTNILFLLGAAILARHLFPNQIIWVWLSYGIYQICHASILIIGFLKRKWLETSVERTEENSEAKRKAVPQPS